MWGKLNQSMLGDNEEGGENFLDEESDGLCNLSATQVPIYNYQINFQSFLFTKIKDSTFSFGLMCFCYNLVVFSLT